MILHMCHMYGTHDIMTHLLENKCHDFHDKSETSGAAGPLVLAPAEGVGAPCHCLFTHAPCGSVGQQTDFLPTPLAGAWVNRWTFSFPFPSHLQLFVSVSYRKCRGGAWVFGCVCHLVVLCSFFMPPTFCLS